MPGRVRIGVSGWNYKPWRGVFYPDKLPHKQELAYVAKIFPCIEVNGTFYSMQKPASFERWVKETPLDFIFSIKGSRFITHTRKLRKIELPLANFFASGVLALGAKLGERDVYVFFDNDAKVRAPQDAIGLTERVRSIFGCGYRAQGRWRHVYRLEHQG